MESSDPPIYELRAAIPGFWRGLMRQMDRETIRDTAKDEKMPGTRLYVPQGDPQAAKFAGAIDVTVLPPLPLTPEYVFSLNSNPGLLALATENGAAVPYIVPGGRFNEFYGWDSYFIGLGLLADGFVAEAKAIVQHFCYEIEHYGKILNANRTYYLSRSQPPFLTDLARRVWDLTKDDAFLATAMKAAVKEYRTVWDAPPRRHECGLARYRPAGHGVPPETEPGHFDWVLEPFASRHGLSVADFVIKYNHQHLSEPELDEFFLHDRAMRESGHDTSSRFANAADLATIDLNALLYKYEVDIAETVALSGENAAEWRARAAGRRRAVDELLWDSVDGLYYDYNTKTGTQQRLPSVTAFWALWSGLASREQAAALVGNLPRFEQPGGLAATPPTARTTKQWDYPCGWAPHQILAWQGLENYGYAADQARLQAKWAAMVAATWQRTGKVLEKYDVSDVNHAENVSAEYGNQGSQRDGFGWTNASLALAVTVSGAQRSDAARQPGH